MVLGKQFSPNGRLIDEIPIERNPEHEKKLNDNKEIELDTKLREIGLPALQ